MKTRKKNLFLDESILILHYYILGKESIRFFFSKCIAVEIRKQQQSIVPEIQLVK